jgi:hypothetical protein
MTEDKKTESVISVRGLLVEFLGAIGEISAKADKTNKVTELESHIEALETKLSKEVEEKDTRTNWWMQESSKVRKLENENKELKAKLEVPASE